MTPSEIKPKMRFGNLEVIKFDHSNEHRVKYFLCKCLVCGNERPFRGTSLISGESTACSAKCRKNIIGKKFGEWIVVNKDKSKRGYYWCECSCGIKKSVFGGSLTTGKSKSCGHKNIENTTLRHKKNAENEIGKQYGWLTILEEDSIRNKHRFYKCRCKCGNEIIANISNIKNGNTSSCGCINSKINEKMSLWFEELKIPFKREYKFEDCKEKRPLPFDFAIFNKANELIGLIENNGRQHYSCAAGLKWNTPERLIKQQKHDYIKRKFCEDNGIPFLVIPYQYFNDYQKFIKTSDFWEIITKNLND